MLAYSKTVPPDHELPMNLEEKEAHLSKLALSLMEKHKVSPTPHNYALWYSYAQSGDKELVREIDQAIEHSIPFTQDKSTALYERYVLPSGRQQKSVDDATFNAQKLLAEIMSVASGLSGETQSYNKNLDQYMEQIGEEIGEGNVQQIFKNLVTATTTLKQSSESTTRKLEESTKEIETLRKNLEQVTSESQRDFLTGVYNRKTFEQFFDEQMVQVKETPVDVCLLMIDIDHFKRFNDKFGHLLGDEVLKIVARALINTLKGRDIVARFGGEEFIVMLPETSLEGGMRVADIIRANIASKELKQKNTGENYGSITVSIGVALLRTSTDTLPTLLKRADEAMYRSKHNGRNCVSAEA